MKYMYILYIDWFILSEEGGREESVLLPRQGNPAQDTHRKWRGEQVLQNTKYKQLNSKMQIENTKFLNIVEKRVSWRKNILLFSKTFYSCASFQMASNATECSTKIMNIPVSFLPLVWGFLTKYLQKITKQYCVMIQRKIFS